MKFLFILNDVPYASERGRNALRLAQTFCLNAVRNDVSVFLMGDSVTYAKEWQSPSINGQAPGQILKEIIANRGHVLACSSCMEARGFSGDELLMDIWLGTLDDLVGMVKETDKIFVY
ncbi:MAG: DsrE family protein [Rhodospirillales bacterium]|nr:DsrE family protein [Rhodospirillales bacterium]